MSAPDIDLTDIHTHMHFDTPLTTRMLGDPNQPLATLVLGDPNKPVTTKMIGDANQPLATLVLGDANKPVTMTMQGNPEKPISMAMEMLNLPRFTPESLRKLMTPIMRIRMPNYMQMCFKLLGQEVFSFCVSGESQTITEPYVPNAHERCEISCCEPDTRPFPERSQEPNG